MIPLTTILDLYLNQNVELNNQPPILDKSIHKMFLEK